MKSQINLIRKPLHLDYFRDYKDRICQVLTWHHPNDRILSIVKYDLGDSFWVSRDTGIRYKRMLKSYSLEGHQDNLNHFSKIEQDYLYHSEVYDVDFLAVPISKIKEYFYPEKRLYEILHSVPKLDSIEKKVKTLAELLNEYLNIPFANMGITGSILWKGQTEKSDIDFIIYGNSFAQNFNELFPQIYKLCDEIKPLNEEKRKRYEESFAKKSGIPLEIARKYITKKTWLSIFDETNLSLIFSPLEKEIPFEYGAEKFSPIKIVEIKCQILNSDLGYAYPAIYRIGNIESLQNEIELNSIDIERLLSFEGALTGYFKKGDEIVVRGLLEEVRDTKTNKISHQIILGTKEGVGNEYILFKEDYENIKK
ncbi:MAG: hypothetical protein ACFFDW_11250 [Candidatus Thorarchaeota archaeon]